MSFSPDTEYRWYDCNLQAHKLKCDQLTVNSIITEPIRSYVYEGVISSGTTTIPITGATLPILKSTDAFVGRITVWAMNGTDQAGEIVYIVTNTGVSTPYLLRVSENTKVHNFVSIDLYASFNERYLYLKIDSGRGGNTTFKMKYEGF